MLTMSQTPPIDISTLLDPGWQDRVKNKLLGTVVLSTAGHALAAKQRRLPVTQGLAHSLAGYTLGMTFFCGMQESLRAARGKHDVLNSTLAGAMTGAALCRIYQGPKYQRLAAVTWGTIATVCHVFNDLVQPAVIIEDLLIDGGLLDPRVAERRRAAQAAMQLPQPSAWAPQAPHPRSSQPQSAQGPPALRDDREESTYIAAELLKRQEMAELANRGWAASGSASTSSNSSAPGQHARGVSAQEGTGAESSSKQQQQGRSWFAWWRRKEAGSAGQQEQSASQQGTSGKGSRHDSAALQEDDDDEAGFQEWLASQERTEDGLVIPSSVR